MSIADMHSYIMVSVFGAFFILMFIWMMIKGHDDDDYSGGV